MSVKCEGATEMSDCNINSGNDERNDEAKKKPFKLWNTFVTAIKVLTVEPCLLLYILAIFISRPPLTNMLIEKVCRADLKYSEDICIKVVKGIQDNNETIAATGESTIFRNNIDLWSDPAKTTITVLLVLLMGAWSDRTGNRKMMMILPVMGEIAYYTVLMLATYFMEEWPLWTIVVTELMVALFTGGFNVAFVGFINYLAEITTKDSRTARFGLFFILASIQQTVLGVISGVLVNIVNAYILFGATLALHVINIIYISFRIKNVRKNTSEGSFFNAVSQFFHPRNVWDAVSIIFTSRGILLAQLIIACAITIINTGTATGESAISTSYALNRHQMDVSVSTMYRAVGQFVAIVGTTIAVSVLSKRFNVHDSWLGILSATSNMLASISYGLAPNKIYYLAAYFVDMFSNVGSIALKSLTTKLVDHNKIGKVVALLGVMETAAPAIFLPLYTQTWTYGVRTKNFGVVYFISVPLLLPAVILFLALYFMHKRKERNEVKNQEVKEMHAYTNDVTAL